MKRYLTWLLADEGTWAVMLWALALYGGIYDLTH